MDEEQPRQMRIIEKNDEKKGKKNDEKSMLCNVMMNQCDFHLFEKSHDFNLTNTSTSKSKYFMIDDVIFQMINSHQLSKSKS